MLNKAFDKIAWIKIFLSPFCVGLIACAVLWFSNESFLIKSGAVGLLISGIVLGILFAEKARKKYGTQEFMSKIYHKKEFD